MQGRLVALAAVLTAVAAQDTPYPYEQGLDLYRGVGGFKSMAERLEKVLRNRCIFLLGDSTFMELFHDLVMLMGIPQGDRDHYIHMSGRLPNGSRTRCVPHCVDYTRVGGPYLDAFPNSRNLSAYSPHLNGTILHRFIGGCDMTTNYQGIGSVTDPKCIHEMRSLLSRGCHGGRAPDYVVVNSGQHDVNPDKLRPVDYADPAKRADRIGYFKTKLRAALQLIRDVTPNTTKVIWRSTVPTGNTAQVAATDSAAKPVLAEFSVNTIVIRDLLVGRRKEMRACCTPDGIHFGTQAKRQVPQLQHTFAAKLVRRFLLGLAMNQAERRR